MGWEVVTKNDIATEGTITKYIKNKVWSWDYKSADGSRCISKCHYAILAHGAVFGISTLRREFWDLSKIFYPPTLWVTIIKKAHEKRLSTTFYYKVLCEADGPKEIRCPRYILEAATKGTAHFAGFPPPNQNAENWRRMASEWNKTQKFKENSLVENLPPLEE